MSDQRQAGRTKCSFIQWPYQLTQHIEPGLSVREEELGHACAESRPTSLTVWMPVRSGAASASVFDLQQMH